MSDALVVMAIAVPAGLVCPAVAWWRSRRGEHASCCLPAEGGEDLRERQKRLAAEIAARAQAKRRAA